MSDRLRAMLVTGPSGDEEAAELTNYVSQELSYMCGEQHELKVEIEWLQNRVSLWDQRKEAYIRRIRRVLPDFTE